MSHSASYRALSQADSRNTLKADESDSLAGTSGELTSSSSQDSLDLVLIEIGNKRKIRRKRRRKMQTFDGSESYEELVGSAKKRKQFFVLGGLCVLAVIVILAIVLSVVLIKKKDDSNNEPLKLDDILQGALQPKRFNGTWIDDNNFYFFDTRNNLVVYNVAEKKSEILVEPKTENDSFFGGSTYEFSPDKKFILSATLVSKIFRHSFLAAWSVYDVENKNLIPVTINSQPALISLVKFSPVDNSMIVIYGNNIYYKKSPRDPEIQITNDGSKNVYNGIPDWVNEEEVFSSNSATWFSPDGKKIAYIRFDDTQVPLMSLPVYGRVGDPAFQYPISESLNYPKVGAKNPEVKLFYVDLTDVVSPLQVVRNEIATPGRFVNSQNDHLITSVSWATKDDLIAVYMNRFQNQGEIQKCTTTSSAQCQAVSTLDVSGGWVEFFTAPFFNKEGNAMVFIGSSEGYRHVISLSLTSPFTRSARTQGKFVVTEILEYNKDANVIMFTANTEEDSRAQHVYAIKNEDGASKTCLTCVPDSTFSYFSAELSKAGSNIVVTGSGPDVPQVHMYSLEFKDNNVTLTNHVELQSNDILKKTLEGKRLPRVVHDKIQLDGSESAVMLFLPADLDESRTYPMIVEVYGGPDSASVTNKWSVEWGTYLASSKEFIYAKIDGRGSGLRGDENLFKLYRNLGTVEVQDQIDTVRKLFQKYSYIDKKKTAIWGWSYGGYVSGMSLASDQNDVFECAVSVAPVTDWTLYDSIYTERYMGLPTVADNAAAYEKSRLMNFVQNIDKNNKTYMLVHGTLDDNVHFQQGMLLARTLERADIQFNEITYPDEDHSLAGVRPHLYHSLERFFVNCFEDKVE